MLPEFFLNRMQTMLGEEYEAFKESFSQEKYQALRLNELKKREDGKLATELAMSGLECAHLVAVPWAKNGYYYEKEDTPGKHPYHEAGVYYIQEPSAMAAVTLLDPKPGEIILDLCAAPGGKSTQIAASMHQEGILITNEIHPARAKILSENIERMGIKNACVMNETPKHLAQSFPEYFDRILVDAPCSGEGMFRKNEIACEEWSLENVELCGERQDEILDCAAQMLRGGGQLVYSTCTFAPIENEGSISRFMRRHSEFELVDSSLVSYGIDGTGVASYITDPIEGIEKTTRLWPHRIKGEGHFVALLRKKNDVGSCTVPPVGLQQGLSAREWNEMKCFLGELVKDGVLEESPDQYMKFGDQIYMIPAGMPNVKGLKVLRPGLHIGTLKKNRFEPSHALALAISPSQALYVWNLSTKDQTVYDYLEGQTFSAEGEKGWYLVCVDGFSIGWGKLAAGIMKNHYPKGLRKKLG